MGSDDVCLCDLPQPLGSLLRVLKQLVQKAFAAWTLLHHLTPPVRDYGAVQCCLLALQATMFGRAARHIAIHSACSGKTYNSIAMKLHRHKR